MVAASDVGDSVSYGNCSQYGCFGVYFPQQSAVGCIQTVYIHVGRAEYDDVFIGGRCPYDTHIRFETPQFSAVGGRITGNDPGVIAYVNFFIPIGRWGEYFISASDEPLLRNLRELFVNRVIRTRITGIVFGIIHSGHGVCSFTGRNITYFMLVNENRIRGDFTQRVSACFLFGS